MKSVFVSLILFVGGTIVAGDQEGYIFSGKARVSKFSSRRGTDFNFLSARNFPVPDVICLLDIYLYHTEHYINMNKKPEDKKSVDPMVEFMEMYPKVE